MKKSKLILVLVLIVLIIILIITVLRFNKFFSEIEEIKIEAMTLQERSDNISEFREKEGEIKEKMKKIQERFIDLKTPIEFIGFLEEKAEENNLLFQISPQPAGSNDWPSLRLQITLKGNFLEFTNFLQELERAPFFLEILNLTVFEEKELIQEIEASLLIKVFGK